MTLIKIIKIASDAMFPRRCVLCDTLLKYGEINICERCVSDIHFIEGKTCPKCGTPLSDYFKKICPQCEGKKHFYDNAFAPFVYEGKIRESLLRFKYNGRASYAAFYADCIYNYGIDTIKMWNPDVIVPVPIHRKRFNERGYNQAELLGNEFSKLTNIPINNSLIRRIKNTSPQKNLNSVQRRENLFSAFALTSDALIPDRVIIIDDIITTGSTVDSLSRILRFSGAKRIYVVCVCTS